MDLNTLSPYIRRTWYSTLQAPWKITERELTDYEIILVASGEALITIDGTPYRVKKRDAVFIPPGVPHSFHVEEGLFVQPHVHFDPIYSEASASRKISFELRDQMSQEQRALIQENIFASYNIPYVFRPAEPERFEKYLFEMIEARQSNREYHTILCKSKLLMLLRLILKQFDPDVKRKDEYNDCEPIKDYIDNNYEQIITLDDLEKQFCINKFTLMRKFKKIYGESIIGYYNNKRLELAKRLLERSNQSITEIAKQLSFTDIYSFSRFFKSHTDFSPKNYRNSFKDKA